MLWAYYGACWGVGGLALVRAALALDPHSADAHHILCVGHHVVYRDSAAATRACQDAVRCAPRDGNMWNTLGEVYRAAGWVRHAPTHMACKC